MDRDLRWLRRRLIAALASDDDLYGLLVMKGGNALSLIHGIGMRASLDLDYSLTEDQADKDRLGSLIERALKKELADHGLVCFDWDFVQKPSRPNEGEEDWGGYQGTFKVIEAERWEKHSGDLRRLQMEAWSISDAASSKKSFKIELSRNEFWEGAQDAETDDGLTLRVYTPTMIAVEKLRAICQQMPEYARRRGEPRARGRDFFDIWASVHEGNVNLTSQSSQDLLTTVFAAKDVPLRLLGRIEAALPFHEQEWAKVSDTIPSGYVTDFSFYSDYVCRIVRDLEPLWVEDAP